MNALYSEIQAVLAIVGFVQAMRTILAIMIFGFICGIVVGLSHKIKQNKRNQY